jgi:hypothetical protein
VQYSILPEILEEEGTGFYRIDRKWQPKNLIPDPYRRNVLKDAVTRLARLEDALDEITTLDRAPLYVKLIGRMRIHVKKSQFAWRTDDLAFLKAIVGFFADYGIVLQNLKIDQARGRLTPMG